MADIKTHLREISVATTIGLLRDMIPHRKRDFYDSKKLFSYANKVIENGVNSATNILDYDVYTEELKEIIDNGYKLGEKIYYSKEFNIQCYDKIQWLGNDTQKGDHIDLKVGKYAFSLKEESFILQNMGLYALLNTLTGTNKYKRGLHVFNTFASNEYDAWFKYTWGKLVEYIGKNTNWTLNRPGKVSTIKKNGTNIIFDYNGETSTIPENIKTNAEYMENTSSTTREKVFAKWIDDILKDDSSYIDLKKKCSETAGKNLANKITTSYQPTNVYQFFQIWPFDYYYAKTTNSETTILHVPNQKNFKNINK